MTELYCPNCGHRLDAPRTDRQPAGRRDVLLEWAMCGACQHVRLVSWELTDEIETEKRQRLVVAPAPDEDSSHSPRTQNEATLRLLAHRR